MAITISRALLDRIVAVARADLDNEVCGLLFGHEACIDAVEPTSNVADDPTRRFEIDPAAHFKAIRAERAGGARIIGHYHSHPSGLAQPSDADAREAVDDGRIWLIVAGESVSAWRLTTGGSFEAVPLVES